MDMLRYRLGLWLCSYKHTQWLGLHMLSDEERADLERAIVQELIKMHKEEKDD